MDASVPADKDPVFWWHVLHLRALAPVAELVDALG